MALMPNMDTFSTNRLIIYIAISLFTTAHNELLAIYNGEFMVQGWMGITILALRVIIQPLIVLRAFMDQSLSSKNHDKE